MVSSSIRNEFDIITVVLGADTKKIRGKDSIQLIEYTYHNYEKLNIRKIINDKFEEWKEANEKQIYINKGVENTVCIYLSEGEYKYENYPFRKDQIKDIQVEISSVKYFEAPVEQDRIIGNLMLELNGKLIEDIEIKICEEIRKKDILDYFYEIVSEYGIILENIIKR